MAVFVDKLILLLCCLSFFSRQDLSALFFAALLSAVFLSSLATYVPKKILPFLCFIHFILCFTHPVFLFFSALLIYDFYRLPHFVLRFLWLLPILFQVIMTHDLTASIYIILLGLLAFYLKKRTEAIFLYQSEYTRLQDSSSENFLDIEQKNRDLLDKRDYEIRLATLNERNRIAREMHDTVGHLLTRALLQTGAIQILNGDTPVKEDLDHLKQTLSQAMDSIRSSVHDLHDESIDLKVQIEKIAVEFVFCPIRLEYSVEQMPREIKYGFLAIIREGIANIAHHSDATQAELIVREHPGFYQLILQDNGKSSGISERAPGIGLQSIDERVRALRGTLHIHREKGFALFISVPKEVLP